jgi:hypothetical protein
MLQNHFEAEELRARVRLGRRILEMQESLAAKSLALDETLDRERLLRSRLESLPQRTHWEDSGLSLAPIAPK